MQELRDRPMTPTAKRDEVVQGVVWLGMGAAMFVDVVNREVPRRATDTATKVVAIQGFERVSVVSGDACTLGQPFHARLADDPTVILGRSLPTVGAHSGRTIPCSLSLHAIPTHFQMRRTQYPVGFGWLAAHWAHVCFKFLAPVLLHVGRVRLRIVFAPEALLDSIRLTVVRKAPHTIRMSILGWARALQTLPVCSLCLPAQTRPLAVPFASDGEVLRAQRRVGLGRIGAHLTRARRTFPPPAIPRIGGMRGAFIALARGIIRGGHRILQCVGPRPRSIAARGGFVAPILPQIPHIFAGFVLVGV